MISPAVKIPKKYVRCQLPRKIGCIQPTTCTDLTFFGFNRAQGLFCGRWKKTPQKFWRKHTSKDAWLNQIKLQQIDCLYQCTYNHKNVMCFIIYYILLYGQGTCRTCCVFMFFLCKKRNAGFSDLLAAKQSTLSLVVFFSGGKTPTVLIHATCLAVSYIHWIQFFKILQNCCHSLSTKTT